MNSKTFLYTLGLTAMLPTMNTTVNAAAVPSAAEATTNAYLAIDAAIITANETRASLAPYKEWPAEYLELIANEDAEIISTNTTAALEAQGRALLAAELAEAASAEERAEEEASFAAQRARAAAALASIAAEEGRAIIRLMNGFDLNDEEGGV